MQEIWKEVEDFKSYSVSNLGNVKNNKTEQYKTKRVVRDYYYVDLVERGRRQNKRLCRLVAKTFIPNILNKEQVNHKDSNKLNDCVDNLEWVTQSENMVHCFKHLKEIGKYQIPKGKLKYTKEVIDKIKELYASGKTKVEISKEMNIPNSTVVHIILGSRRSLQ